ncbi:MAG: hypothetical protein NXI00_05545 [Cytophagales bacterium]|nr:hypothetical protein [Cytophagales bacterium]
MTSIRTRPRFRLESSLRPEEIKNRLKEKLINHGEITGAFYDIHCSFDISISQRHFWSPHLNLNLEETETGTILRGRYGPAPTIWTVFMFAYGALGISFLFIALFGLSQMALKQASPILWALPVITVGIVTLWLIGQTGQKLGVEQTFRIHHFLEDAIGENIHVH